MGGRLQRGERCATPVAVRRELGRDGSEHVYALRVWPDPYGVAIRTTAARLKESLVGSRKPPITGAKVQYVDYSTTFIPEGNLFFPFMHKRSSFSHESEYRLLAMWTPEVLEADHHNRAVRTEPNLPPPFLREPVDLDRLVESVYVSPDAPDWVAGVVGEVTGKYKPGLGIRHSDLAADPVY